MSQSSITEQVQDFGLPVRQGTRMSRPVDGATPKPTIDPAQYASDLWFSRWTHNAFANYPVVRKGQGVRFLANAAKGLPAFVVGVGPSLDADIVHLKGLRRQAVIISTDAAYRALRANGIIPDLVISYDCKKEQSLLWSDMDPAQVMDPAQANPPMLFSSCAHPDVIKSWPGKVLFYNQFHGQDQLCGRILPDVFPEIGQLPSGGTVGNMACFLAHCLGCNPICVVGMDFCYEKTGDAWRYRAQDYRWVPRGEDFDPGWKPTAIKELYDNDERMRRSFMTEEPTSGLGFRTDHELEHYRNTFCELMPHFELPIINCTPKGLLPPKAFAPMTVEAARDTYCKETWQDGRTILHHLNALLQDPRR